ncbi:MAG: hypothetical protein M3245_01005, partial [Actinomycetota bacterium]|nr:hypothetical protein [Actinomycetota bacterium]
MTRSRRLLARFATLATALALVVPAPSVSALMPEDPLKTVQDTVTPPEEECQPNPDTGQHCHGRGPAAPEEWMLAQRLDEDGQLAPDAYEAALEESAGMEQWPGLLDTQWSLAGPTNIGGRLTDVAVDPELPNTVYVSAATGGIWKSTDAGATFASIWPDETSQSMGSLAMASDGTLFAGTGEANPGGGSITFAGTGVYRSRDRGATWDRVGLENSSTNGRIMVDPTNPNRVFVAATGSLFNPGGDRGVYRTEDGGDTWEQVLAPETDFTGGVDLAIDPVNPDRVFATMWDHRRQPHLRTYGGVGSGVFRSTDGGDTWTRLSNVSGSTDLERSSNLGRLKVAVAPSNPNRVYVFAITATGPALGFYVSDDGGDSFVKRASNSSLSGSQSTFGWWFGRIWVDPNNANRVFAGGVSLQRSDDAGVSWTNTGSGTHADHHAMAWDLKVPNRVYLGNDGGFYRSTANGAGSWTKATYEPYTQIYIVDTSQQDNGRLTIGTQDNGCIRSWSSTGVVNPSGAGWGNFGSCGDGLYTVIDHTDHNFVYGCSQYGSCSRSTNAGNSSSGFGATTSQRRNWQTPVVLDPNDPQIVYYGGNILNRSTNRAAAFTAISPDLTGGPGADPNYPFGTMTTIAVAKTAPNTIWVGTDDGRVWKTTTGGGTTTSSWTRIQDDLLPERWVTRIAVDAHDDQLVYVTFSGFRNGEDTAHVFRTTDGGATWSNISGNLPNAPVNDVVLHPSGSYLYVATDVGVFVSKPGRTWYRIGEGPPLAPVMDLAYHTASNTMVAGTFGRSSWRLNLDREAQPPVTIATVTPEPRNGWHRDPTVTLAAEDGEGAGVERTEYRIDAGPW